MKEVPASFPFPTFFVMMILFVLYRNLRGGNKEALIRLKQCLTNGKRRASGLLINLFAATYSEGEY